MANEPNQNPQETDEPIAIDTIQVEDLDDLLSNITSAAEESADDAAAGGADDAAISPIENLTVEDVTAQVDALSESVAALDEELQGVAPDAAIETEVDDSDAVDAVEANASPEPTDATEAADTADAPAPPVEPPPDEVAAATIEDQSPPSNEGEDEIADETANVAESEDRQPEADADAPEEVPEAASADEAASDPTFAIDDLGLDRPIDSRGGDLVTDDDLAVAEAEIKAQFGSEPAADDEATPGESSAAETDGDKSAKPSKMKTVLRRVLNRAGKVAAFALVLIDKPFAGWPVERKDAVGYAAVATLLMSGVAWMLSWTVVS